MTPKTEDEADTVQGIEFEVVVGTEEVETHRESCVTDVTNLAIKHRIVQIDFLNFKRLKKIKVKHKMRMN